MLLQLVIANEVFAANKVGSIKGDNKLIKKYRKLLKTRKLSKSQKLAKLKKKLSKSRNLPNFDTKENGSSFSIPNAKTTFNHL